MAINIDRPTELKGLLAFAGRNPLSRPPLVTTRTRSGVKQVNGIELEFIPTSIHCYTIGRNVLQRWQG